MRFLKWFFTLFIFLIGLSIALIALAPTLLSTNWGKKRLVAAINKTISGQLEIEALSLSWFSGQEIKAVRLWDTEKRPIFECASLTTQATLWSLLTDQMHLEGTLLNKPHLLLITDTKGKNNLTEALAPRHIVSKNSHAAWDGKLPFSGSIEIREGMLSLEQADLAPIVLDGFNLQISASEDFRSIICALRSHTIQDNLSGDIDIHLRAQNSQDALDLRLFTFTNGVLAAIPGTTVQMQASILNLPVSGLDQLIALAQPRLFGLLRSALGPTLNVSAQLDAHANFLFLNLDAHSAKLHASIASKLQDNQLYLTAPATLSLALTTDLLKRVQWMGLLPIPLKAADDALFEATLSELVVALGSSAPGFHSTQAQGGLKITGLSALLPAPVEEIPLQTLQATISTPANSNNLDFQLVCTAQNKNNPATFTFSGTWADLFDAAGLFQPTLANVDASLNVSALPTKWIDVFLPQANLLTQLLGNDFSLLMQLKGNFQTAVGTLSLQSPNLLAQHIQMAYAQNLELHTATPLTLSISQDLLNPYLAGIQASTPVHASLAIQKLQIPLPWKQNSSFQLADIVLAASATIQPLQLAHVPFANQILLKKCLLSCEASPLSHAFLRGDFSIDLSDNQSLAALLIGPELSCQTQTAFALNASGAFLPGEAKFQLQSRNIQGELAGRFDQTAFSANDVRPLTLHLVPEFADQLKCLPEGEHLLLAPIDLALQISKLRLPLQFPQDPSLLLEAVLTSEEIQINPTPWPKDETILKNFYANAVVNGATNTAAFSGHSAIFLANDASAGAFSFQIALAPFMSNHTFDLKQASIKTDLHAQGIPVVFIENLTSQSGLLTPLLGERFNFSGNIDLKTTHPLSGKATVSLDSPNLTLHSALLISEDAAIHSAGQPTTLDWNLTPQGFQALKGWMKKYSPVILHQELQLAQPAHLTLSLPSFTLNSTGSFALSQLLLNGELTLDRLAIVDQQQKEVVALSNTDLLIKQLDLKALTQLQFQTALSTAATPAGKIEADISISNALLPEGRFNPAGMAVEIVLNGSSIPVSWVDNLLVTPRPLLGALPTLLGEPLDVAAEATIQNLSGPLLLRLGSANGSLEIDGELTHGILTLKHPLTASFQITAASSQALLQDVNPFLVSAVGSLEPITLWIDPRKFSLPLYPLDFTQASIAQGILDLHKIRITNKGPLASLLSFLKIQSASNEMTAWFVPTYFHLANGLMTFERTDALIDTSAHIATWGYIDLKKELVEMTLGIGARTLQHSFGINGLPEAYMLLMPIEGSLKKINIGWGQATAQIAALIAANQTSNTIVGNILNMVNQTDPGEQNLPAPRTSLPWETQGIVPPYNPYPQNLSHSSSDSTNDPLNEILNWASGLMP